MINPSIIGIVGPIGSGKSTISNFLYTHYNYEIIKFASTLKAMLLCIPGITIDHVEGSLKSEPSPYLEGLTPRYLMQTLGTEWGRDIVGQDFWVNCWKRLASDKPFVVADDVRFPNEAEAIKELGGVLWYVDGRGVTDGHKSESYLNEIPFDYKISNKIDGVGKLYYEVELALKVTGGKDASVF